MSQLLLPQRWQVLPIFFCFAFLKPDAFLRVFANQDDDIDGGDGDDDDDDDDDDEDDEEDDEEGNDCDQ
jgi:hypothetical protein